MLEPEIDLLAAERGTITAPAGCGKTQLVANALARHAAQSRSSS
jgi:ATP/maltotriose-dependent transcriptional regulator MalT